MNFINNASSTSSDMLVTISEPTKEKDNLKELYKKFIGKIDLPDH